MNQLDILKYYSQESVQNAILKIAKDREVAGSFKDGSFFHRPDTLIYPKDIIERVKRGIVSFHCSVEKWKNPMQLSSEIKQRELDNLRKGFDLILDIDSKSKLEHAIIATQVVCEFIKDLNIKPTLKFSGSRGFHIAIAENAFPESIDFKKTSKKYPEVPQALASFVKEKIKDRLLEELISYEGGVAALVKCVDSISELSPYEFIEIEENWGNRHLFRMPYSLHTKKWLVSVPLKIEQVKNFKLEMAKPENIKTTIDFLVNKDAEATELLLQALDWSAKHKPEPIPKTEKRFKLRAKIPEEHFPPCIKKILSGLSDGRKRSLFTLATFLRAMNWDNEEIEKTIREWNERNAEALTNRFITTQLKWHFRQSRELMPPNSDSDLFYRSIGITNHVCGKNPVNYAIGSYMRRNKRIKR